ncbi:hypothetical protein GCM10027200_18300 [Lentzea nigeriaca]
MVLFMAAVFMSHAGGPWLILLVAVSVATFIVYLGALAGYRPKGEKWAIVPTMLILFASFVLTYIGSHSLWLTAFGETVHCKVIDIETHKSGKGSTLSNNLDCNGRKSDHVPSWSNYVQKPGTEMDIVVDKKGFVGSLEPDEVTPGHNLLLLGVVLLNAALMLLVARLPVRQKVTES